MAKPANNPSYTLVADEGAGNNTISGTTEEIIAANPDRQYVRIRNNDGSIIVSLGLGVDAVSLKGIVLGAGESWEMPSHAIFTGAIDAIGASGTPVVSFVEY